MVGPGLHAWLCVGADLDPPFFLPELTHFAYDRGRSKCHDPWGCSSSPQGAFGLRPRLSKRRDASLISRFSRPAESASTPHGEERSPCNNKNPHRTADGTLRVRITTAGGLSPRHRASREDIILDRGGSNTFDPYAGGCAAHGVILLTGRIRRLTKYVILDP